MIIHMHDGVAWFSFFNHLYALMGLGKKLPINRSEQNRIHDPLGFHIFVWESIISHIPQSDCCSMEFPWGACDILWGSSAMASRLQYKQHLYYKWSRFDHIILQISSPWICWGGRRCAIHSLIPMCSWCSNNSKSSYIYFLMCFFDGHFDLVYAKVTPIFEKKSLNLIIP